MQNGQNLHYTFTLTFNGLDNTFSGEDYREIIMGILYNSEDASGIDILTSQVKCNAVSDNANGGPQ